MNPHQLTPEQRQELEEKLKNMSPEEITKLQKQQCVFCKLVLGEIPSKKIYEDEKCLAVLDINPATKGHLLLMPKEHYLIMPQVPNEVLGHLFAVAKSLSKLLLKSLRVTGTNLVIANGVAAGQRAQHFMIQVLPRKEGDSLLKQEEKLINKEIQEKIILAVKGRLNLLLGVKEEVQQKLTEEDKGEKEKEKNLINEGTNCYHNTDCTFAQNIPEEKRIIMKKEEASLSEKKPRACVSGRKIPLKKDENKLKKILHKHKLGEKNIVKNIVKKSKKTEKKEKIIEDEETSLDDIAELFR